jgi:hypothetical protein
VASAARELLNKTDNERSGVVSTAMTLLGLYRDPIVARMTSGSDWRIADLLGAERPVSLYLVVPPSDISRTRPLVRLILNQIGRRLTERYDAHHADAGGLRGVARATVSAPVGRAVASSTAPVRDAYREGAAQGYRDAGPPSGPDPNPPGGGPGGGTPTGSPPAWAQRLSRRQRMTQAGLIAAQGLREGDRPALSPGPDLKDNS